MKLLGILAFGALLVVAFGYVTIFGGPTSLDDVDPGIDDQTESPLVNQAPIDPATIERVAFAGAGTIESLFMRGATGPIECQITFIPSALEPAINGSMFVSDGQVRADFIVPSPDMTGEVVASVIHVNEMLYVWSEINGETFGMRMSQPTFNGFGDSAADMDLDTEVQYDCLTWPAVDNTIFEPPARVLFTDMTNLTGNMEFGVMYENEAGELPL